MLLLLHFSLLTDTHSATFASEVNDTAGVYFVPAFSGLFAPRWRDDARGVIVGLTQFANKRHICRAVLEAICFQSKEVIDAMVKDVGATFEGANKMMVYVVLIESVIRT